MCWQLKDFFYLGGPAPDVAVGLSVLTSGYALVNVLLSLPQSALATRRRHGNMTCRKTNCDLLL